jgi:hypothetical protein
MTDDGRRSNGTKTVWQMIAKTTNDQRSEAGKVGGRLATGIRWTCTTHGLTSSPCGIGNHRKKHHDCVIAKPAKEARPRTRMSEQGRANIRAASAQRGKPNPSLTATNARRLRCATHGVVGNPGHIGRHRKTHDGTCIIENVLSPTSGPTEVEIERLYRLRSSQAHRGPAEPEDFAESRRQTARVVRRRRPEVRRSEQAAGSTAGPVRT